MSDMLTDRPAGPVETVTPDELLADAIRPDGAPAGPYADRPDDPWEVTGTRTAEWAMQMIRAAHARFVDRTEGAFDRIRWHEEQIAELRGFVDSRAAERDGTVGFFEGKLIGWLRRIRAAEIGKGVPDKYQTKSVPLPGGVVKSRAARPRVDIVDVDAFVEWAESTDDAAGLVRRVPKPDLRGLRSYVRVSGEAPPGVEWVEASEDDRAYAVEVT